MATLPGGSLVVVWDEVVGGKRRAVAARAVLDGDDRPRFTRTILSDGEPAIYPAVAASSEAAIVAWTSGNSAVIRVARLPMAGAAATVPEK
jgi:hypothetical protein